MPGLIVPSSEISPKPFGMGCFMASFITGGSIGVISVPHGLCGWGPVYSLMVASMLPVDRGAFLSAGLCQG